MQDQVASTGPRSFERGIATLAVAPLTDFKLQRGRALSSAEFGCHPHVNLSKSTASTGPRSFERGILIGRHILGRFQLASTGPRSFERGILSVAGFFCSGMFASTGPRSFERGILLFIISSATGSQLYNCDCLHHSYCPHVRSVFRSPHN